MTRYTLTVQVTVLPDGRLLRSRYHVDAETLSAASVVSEFASERYMEQLINRYVPHVPGTEVGGTGTWHLSRVKG